MLARLVCSLGQTVEGAFLGDLLHDRGVPFRVSARRTAVRGACPHRRNLLCKARTMAFAVPVDNPSPSRSVGGLCARLPVRRSPRDALRGTRSAHPHWGRTSFAPRLAAV